MTSDGTDLLRTVSRWTVERMRRLGATVTDTSIEATEEQLWKGMSPSHRRQLELKGNLTVAGGSSVPDWVPENAKIYIDLVNDRAWTEADGIVAIDTLLGTDANTVNGWGTTEYDPSMLTADGYTPTVNRSVAFIGSSLTKILTGATIVARWKQTATTSYFPTLALMSADGNNVLGFSLSSNDRKINVYTYDTYNQLSDVAVMNIGAGAINVIACTTDGVRANQASNGSSVVGGDIGASELTGLATAVVDIASDGNVSLQSITIYDALPSTAGLSALSETGVTNTAPHTLTWVNHLNGGDDAFEIDTGWPLTTGRQIIDTIAAVDDQGNPLTIALSDDGAGQFILEDGNVNVTSDINDPAGPFNFTLRATDPGGLYVEQQFTITVTA